MLLRFFSEYFILPVLEGSGYNIYNTIAYGFLLMIAAVLVYKFLRAKKIAIDSRFLIGITPFIILGGVLRASEDIFQAAGFGKNVFLITPLIYGIVFAVALAFLLLSRTLREKEYHKLWFSCGAVLIIISLAFSFIYVDSLVYEAVLAIASLTIVWFVVVFAAGFFTRSLSKFFSRINSLVLSAHMFDASTTFVAISNYSYFEQHVVPSFLIGLVGPIAIFAVKLIVVSLVLYVFDRELKKNESNYLKMIVLMLGLAPGTRNLLRIAAGV